MAAGASLFTFAGLAGLGDLIATCASPLSRNRTLGELLARGHTMEETRTIMHGQVAEGLTTTVAARELAARYGVEMPITQQLYEVLFEGKSAMLGLSALLTREPTDEFLSLGVTTDRRTTDDVTLSHLVVVGPSVPSSFSKGLEKLTHLLRNYLVRVAQYYSLLAVWAYRHYVQGRLYQM